MRIFNLAALLAEIAKALGAARVPIRRAELYIVEIGSDTRWRERYGCTPQTITVAPSE